MRTIVNAVLLRGNCVLLARRSPQRTAYPGLWSFPGGHVEIGETIEQALVREILEEISVAPTTYAHIATIADPHVHPRGHVTYYIYSVTAWSGGEPTLIGDEHTELRWFSLPEATALTELALPEYTSLFTQLAATLSATSSA
jgi:8-oxo-dGTP diphosphatase